MEKCSSIRQVIDEDINSGFDAYLVGGCVRDLILNRVPKDYDVITTADLKQIRRLFHRAQVIGKRFPICHVWMGGSIIEVSSFDTVAHSDSDLEKSKEKSGVSLDTKANKNNSLFKMYSGWDIKDCKRWRNSLQRDFTINSLFYNPFDFTIYDYANGMEDLTDLKFKVLTILSWFSPNTARILRGLRIAARLGLSLSKDVKTAIPEFVFIPKKKGRDVAEGFMRLTEHQKSYCSSGLLGEEG
uniref:Putative poly(A) polymerase n=1 Tax=Arabidopsis thaliana TaxID=3702 RepID=Q9SHL1_ARATH|nr:putative poly(A) polymerase [Arabidopsis thaliana]